MTYTNLYAIFLSKMLLFLAVSFAGDALVAEAGKSCANERSYDEEPELRESESVLGEECLRDRTCGVNRRVGQRNRDQVDQGQGQTDSQATKSTVSMLAVRHAEDNHQEDKRQDALGCESTPNIRLEITTCYICIAKELSITVRGESTDFHTCGFSDTKEDCSSSDSAEDLCTPVAEHLFGGHTTVDKHTEADRRIEVCTADMTDTISRRNDRQTEREGYAQKTNMSKEGRSTTAQNQYCRSEELCSKLVT